MTKNPSSESNVVAVVLAAEPDFGRCPLASRLPRALWPVAGESVLQRLVTSLTEQGVKRIIICSNKDGSLLGKIVDAERNYDSQIEFLDEPLPAGTAGCIREAARGQTANMFLVLPAGLVNPPDVDALIHTHLRGCSDLTVVFNPPSDSRRTVGEPAGIYLCNRAVLEYIPEKGYFDIKESLIAEMLRAGKNIHSAVLQSNVGSFRNWQEYLAATLDRLAHMTTSDLDLSLSENNQTRRVWKGRNVTIDPNTQLHGPVVLLEGSSVGPGAVVFGPAVVGRNVSIDADSFIANSILWDNSSIGRGCQVRDCVIDQKAALRNGSMVEGRAVAFEPAGVLKSFLDKTTNVIKNNAAKMRESLVARIDKALPERVRPDKKKTAVIFGAALVLLAFIWCYWPDLVDLWNIWQRSDEYSSGLLVPFLTVYILWTRRHHLAKVPIKPCLWGVLALILAQAVRFFGVFFMYGSAMRLSVVLTVAALVLLLCGWPFFRKVSTVLLFLCLMLPWPNRVQAAVALPLQRWATSSSVFCLEMMGYEAIQEGNIIHVGSSTVAVAEACNGLRMITAFFVISGLVVLLVKRTWWEKLTILASSLPIALLCNTVRLTLTAIAFTILSGEQWEKIFHDFGGYAMMPLALAIVVAELWLLARLFTPPLKQQTITIRRRGM
jgi:exosortase